MGAGPASSNGSKDTQVSGYETEINKQKEKDKAAKDKAAKDKAAKDKAAKEKANNNTYKTSREIGITTQYSKTRQQDIKEEKEKAFQEQGAYNTRRSIENTFSPIVKIFGPGISEPLQKNAIRTRNFFTDYVLGEGGKKNSLYAGMNKSQFEQLSVEKQNEMYSEYSKNRMSGTRDAYGRKIIGENSGNDGNNTIGQVTKTAPTTAEVSQATTAEAAGATAAETAKTTEANRLLKIKKKGRSQSIMTDPKGVTKTSTDYSLGKKSLLGIV
jgi:hypothetical protein